VGALDVVSAGIGFKGRLNDSLIDAGLRCVLPFVPPLPPSTDQGAAGILSWPAKLDGRPLTAGASDRLNAAFNVIVPKRRNRPKNMASRTKKSARHAH
jgi:hypothetical protein